MAFSFDDYENMADYTFAYPTSKVLGIEYQKWLKKPKNRISSHEYKEFIIKFVKERIILGYNRYREYESEWEVLLYYIEEIEKEFNAGTAIATEKTIILYDQALLLFYEGFPLPPNILC